MDEFDVMKQIAEIKLKEEKQLTDLEKDILDTFDKINDRYFDRDGAIFQIIKNNGNYPEAYTFELINPQNKIVDVRTLPDNDLLHNLQIQLEYMVEKEISIRRKEVKGI